MCCELGRGVCICQVKEWEGSVMIWSSGFLKSCYYCLPGPHRCVAFYSAASVNWWTFWNLSWVTWLPSVKLQRSPWCFWGYALDVVHLLKNIPNSSNLLTLVTSLKLKLAMATFLQCYGCRKMTPSVYQLVQYKCPFTLLSQNKHMSNNNKEVCLPLHNQNSRRHSIPRSLSPGNGGTIGITVETLQNEKISTDGETWDLQTY